jgi:hypothetical protein
MRGEKSLHVQVAGHRSQVADCMIRITGVDGCRMASTVPGKPAGQTHTDISVCAVHPALTLELGGAVSTQGVSEITNCQNCLEVFPSPARALC